MRALSVSSDLKRRYPIGAEIIDDGVSFRVWAPARRRVSVVFEGGLEGSREQPLEKTDDQYFCGVVRGVGARARYRFRLDEGSLYPDPASRRQPSGPHGPSEVVDPHAFTWTDRDWKGVALPGQVIYEMHVGTFTPEGAWAAAAQRLATLKEIGVALIEMMPVNDFPGRFNWGYDGVGLFAPVGAYGAPDDLKRFIDVAHGVGLGVILDVVYNHFGPDGSYFDKFTPDYFTDRYENEWGASVNFDGPNCAGVREFFMTNAAYWIDEFHFDGLRIDATQTRFDASDEHIIAAIGEAARKAAEGRSILLIAENEPQHSRLVATRENGGYGLDALWNDDFHHSTHVALTGRPEAYYQGYQGIAQEFVSSAKYGFLYQGQRYDWQDQPRGSPSLTIAPRRFVNFLENHDQVANSPRGLRFHMTTSPGRARALTALLLLAPQTPMLFQGQEFWSSAPFRFFADAEGALADAYAAGRKEFLSQFPNIAEPAMAAALARPTDARTFLESKLGGV